MDDLIYILLMTKDVDFLDASWLFDIRSLIIINLALFPILIGLFGFLEFILLSCLYVLDISSLSHVGFVFFPILLAAVLFY